MSFAQYSVSNTARKLYFSVSFWREKVFNEYTDSDDELDQEGGFNGSSNPSSFFARVLEKKIKSYAIKAAEAA